jgi:AcrR family transcriptional regulator
LTVSFSGAIVEEMVTEPLDKPVQARSLATRAALLDAAVECLAANGYASLTTNDIARRAGVSRGAQLHHFPTKADLMAASVEHLPDRRLREFQAALTNVPPGAADIDALIDLVWSLFDGPAFVAWVELWVAARTDAVLAATMVGVDRRFTAESRRLAVEALVDVGMNDTQDFELLRDFTFALLTGLAVQHLVPRGQRPASDIVDTLKAVVPLVLERGGPEGRS